MSEAPLGVPTGQISEDERRKFFDGETPNTTAVRVIGDGGFIRLVSGDPDRSFTTPWGSAAGTESFQLLAQVALDTESTYQSLEWTVQCRGYGHFEVRWDNNGTPTVLVGPKTSQESPTNSGVLTRAKFTTGTGTQRLLVYGQNNAIPGGSASQISGRAGVEKVS